METENKTDSLTDKEFNKLSLFIDEQCGIKMPLVKKNMLEARIRKRLRELKIATYSEYCNYIFSSHPDKAEITKLVDVITTNKTDFFREPKQFDFLSQKAIPELISESRAGINRPLNVWSAGCSTGEEPYTISIVLHEYAHAVPNFSFNILATDISTKVLEKAHYAIYEENKIEPIDTALVKKYFLRSKDRQKKLVRLIPEIRNSVKFKWLNFHDDDFNIKETFDVIFCRNVIIYFDKQMQYQLLKKLTGYLKPGGFFFLGHSESIINMNLPLIQLAASTYRKSR